MHRASLLKPDSTSNRYERIVTDIPAPTGDPNAPLQALIFDSYYDSYKGVIVYIRVMHGTVRPGDDILMMATKAQFHVVEVGYMGATTLVLTDGLSAGEVGYITASIKSVKDTVVGDTVTLVDAPAKQPLDGYRQVNPMVFCGIYPATMVQNIPTCATRWTSCSSTTLR